MAARIKRGALPLDQNASDLPSGDQNGRPAFSVPGSARASSGRPWSRFSPFGVVTRNASVLPFGEMAEAPALPIIVNLLPAGGAASSITTDAVAVTFRGHPLHATAAAAKQIAAIAKGQRLIRRPQSAAGLPIVSR